MPIISKPLKFDTKFFFAFHEKDILLKNGSLLSKNDFIFFVKEKLALDWYTEPNLSYSAISLKSPSPLPLGFSFIPLRQFFHEHKEASNLASRAKSLLSQRVFFIFCPSCGKKLEDDKTETAKYCASCKKKFFPRIEPATITLVSHGNKILLIKNKNTEFKHYGLVSGFVEAGETAEECAMREIKEETNIEVKNLKYIGSQAWPYPDQLMLAFKAEYKSGKIKIQESEIEDARWFDISSLPPDEELPHPGSVAWRILNGKI